MKKILYINACVRTDSRTEKLCKKYLEKCYLESEYSVKEIKLKDLKLQPMYENDLEIRNTDIENNDLSKPEYKLAKEFALADLIVVSAPYWDCSFPSMLKVYFEHICVNNIAFSYSESGKLIKKCRAERLIYVSTAGGFIRQSSSVQMFLEEFCALLGIGDFRFYCAQGLDVYKDKVEEITKKTLEEMCGDVDAPSKVAIPTVEVPQIVKYNILPKDEELVSLSERGFAVESQYYIHKIKGSFPDCYARKTVADMLEKAREYLPKGINFKIYDAYRPIEIQQTLWDFFYKRVSENNPDAAKEEIELKTSFFVSKPSYDVMQPSLHNTGGAVDLSLISEYGDGLDMGTDFDTFEETSWTNYFENRNSNLIARENRRILYYAMLKAGFTNLPSEWWHYDYGTKFWAYFKNTSPIYKGVLSADFPDKIK